jgi:hypothetical protein
VNKISFKQESYKDAPFLPGWQFFKTLQTTCGDTQMRLNMPTTLVSGFSFESPCLFYTNSSGILKVRRHANTDLLDIFMKKLDSEIIDSRKGLLKPLAIAKMPNSEFNRVLMRMSEIRKIWNGKDRNDMVLQQYIFPKGRKACKVRLVYDLDRIKVYIVSNYFRLDGKLDAEPGKTPNEMMRSTAANTTNMIKTVDSEVYKNTGFTEEYTRFQWSNIEDGNYKSDKEDKSSGVRRRDTLKGKVDLKTSWCEIDTDENEAEVRVTRQSKRESNYRGSSRNLDRSISIKDASGELEQYFRNVISPPKNFRQSSYIDFDEDEDLKVSFGLVKKLRQMYCTDLNRPENVNIYESKNLKLFTSIINETKQLMDYIDKVSLKNINMRISRAVCDYCEDKDGNWWFLKMKAARFIQVREKKKLLIKNHKFECPGEYCKVTIGFDSNDSDSNIFKVSPKVSRNQSRKVLRRILDMHRTHSPGSIIDMLDPKQYDEVKVCKNCYFVYNEQSRKKDSEPDKVNQVLKKKRYDKIIQEIDPETPAVPITLVQPQESRMVKFIKSRASSFSKIRLQKPSQFFQNILDSSYVRKRRKAPPQPEKSTSYLSYKKNEIDTINAQIDKKLRIRLKPHHSFTSL